MLKKHLRKFGITPKIYIIRMPSLSRFGPVVFFLRDRITGAQRRPLFKAGIRTEYTNGDGKRRSRWRRRRSEVIRYIYFDSCIIEVVGRVLLVQPSPFCAGSPSVQHIDTAPATPLCSSRVYIFYRVTSKMYYFYKISF